MTKFKKYFSIFLKDKTLLILLVLCLLTFFLRVIKIEDLFYFTYDEEIPAYVGRRLILFHHIPLIGGVTPFGVHLAPYFYWFMGGLLGLSNLNPIIWGWAGAVLSIFTTLLIYIVGRDLSSKKTGIFAAILWTFSYLANLFDRHLWALYWGPIVALITIFCLNKIVKNYKRSKKYIYILAIVLAISFHADLSNFVFILLTLIVWFIYKLPIKKEFLISLGIFLIFLMPLVIFDLRHDFANSIRPVSRYLEQKPTQKVETSNVVLNNILIYPVTSSRLVYSWGDNETSKQYSYCQEYIEERLKAVPLIAILISSGILIGFLIWSSKNRKYKGWLIVNLTIITFFVGLSIYGIVFSGPVYEHYITGLFPLFFLILALVLSKLPNKIALILLLIFISFNLYKLSNAQDSLGYKNKKEAIAYTLSQIDDREFSLESLSSCWKYSGYRYMFDVFGRPPIKSFVDPNLAYLYKDQPISDKHPDRVVAFVIDDFNLETKEYYQRLKKLEEHTISSSQFGRIKVLIIDNSTGWYD